MKVSITMPDVIEQDTLVMMSFLLIVEIVKDRPIAKYADTPRPFPHEWITEFHKTTP